MFPMKTPRSFVVFVFVFVIHLLSGSILLKGNATIEIASPMAPPEWALLQRELLLANAVACEEFYEKYFDERGWLECIERWGGDDGPDDAIENVADWPILHALGGDDNILTRLVFTNSRCAGCNCRCAGYNGRCRR